MLPVVAASTTSAGMMFSTVLSMTAPKTNHFILAAGVAMSLQSAYVWWIVSRYVMGFQQKATSFET